VWPVSPCEFFLERAVSETDAERASGLFLAYLSWFPNERTSFALAEAGFKFLAHRPDVLKTLNDWNVCGIEEWRIDQSNALENEKKNKLENRTKNISHLSSRMTTLRNGSEEGALVWAAGVYLGFYYDISDISGAHERLLAVTNDEIADAIIEGFIRYVEQPTIPTKQEIIKSSNTNSVPYVHILLGLSVYLRIAAGMTIPSNALPHCIAAVVTGFHAGDKVPGYDKTLSTWLLQQAHEDSVVLKAVLKEIWLSAIQSKKGNLPNFYELSQDPGSQQFLSELSAEILRMGINEDKETVCNLVSVLLMHDQRVAHEIGGTELTRNELSPEVQIIWQTALFLIDPSTYAAVWKNALISGPETTIWAAIQLIKNCGQKKGENISLTSAQRAELISVIGQRFPKSGYPHRAWWGNQNVWDASDFISGQIKQLAADSSATAGAQLERLESDGSLRSYRDLIRHHSAQHEKQQRDLIFIFASPEQVAEAIRNRAPATASDLLAFVVDHLSVLSREIGRKQTERYRAYWNEHGQKLDKPKYEEVCSGLLAEDLQNRIQAQNLIVTVEHHMIEDKECDVVVLQGTERLLPIEVKHHFNKDLWTAWRIQLDGLYSRDAKAGGLGVYLVLWSGEAEGRKMPKLPDGLKRPTSAVELRIAIEALIPEGDRHRLWVVVMDISGP
jgi:hypothetical protein